MEDKGITPLQRDEASQLIQVYYAKHGLDYDAIDWDNAPLPWWPEELVQANKIVNDFYDQFPEGDLL